jgi:O-antigen/teichoic acid export membrane protein
LQEFLIQANVPGFMMNVLHRLAARVYDSAVAWTLVFAVVRSCGNLLVLPLMLHKLPQEDLGFWYVFLSMGGLSALVDMGFFPSMSRVTAYLWAGAKQIDKLGVTPVQEEAGSILAPNYRLLADLVKTMRLYYLGLGILITLVLGIFGTNWIMHKANHLANTRTIIGAWLLFLPAIFVNVASGMWHPLLSGINQVRLNQQILVWSLITNYVITFVGLLIGLGLFAPVAGYLAMGFLSRAAAQAKFNQLSQGHAHRQSARWSRELLGTLWPTAWRTGIVMLGIYATLHASTLICTAYLGLKATASFGLSMQLALAAMSIATGFFIVKIPLIAQLRARGKAHEISQIVFPRMRWFWAVYIGLSLTTVLFGQPVLQNVLHSKTPLLSAPVLTALFVVIGLEGHHAVFREITLTSHRNPFAAPVLISGILIVLLSLILVQWIGLWGLILAPGVVQICFNNWWTVVIGLRSMGNSVEDYVFGLLGLSRARPSPSV